MLRPSFILTLSLLTWACSSCTTSIATVCSSASVASQGHIFTVLLTIVGLDIFIITHVVVLFAWLVLMMLMLWCVL